MIAGDERQSTALAPTDDAQTVSVAEAANLLGRDRTRVYALLRSGDLVAAAAADDDVDGPGPMRIVRKVLYVVNQVQVGPHQVHTLAVPDERRRIGPVARSPEDF